jgi:tetratricopeptide (TPR) repeat protein
MKWIKQFIIVTSFAQTGLGQNLQQTFEFGQQQFDQNHWQIAEKTFHRVLFFDEENIYRAECLRGLAVISKLNGDETAALNYLDQLYFISKDPEIQSDLQFDRIQIFIEQHEFQKALAELYQIESDIAPFRLALYEGYCQYMLHDFVATEQAFETLCKTPIEKEALAKFLLEAEKIEKFNPKTFQILSYFIPGLGQILLGDTKSSLNSLLLNGGLVVLFIDTARKLSLFDATLSVLPWFYRYYTGGVKVTKDLAIERKENLHKQNLANMIHVMTGFADSFKK